MSQVEASAPGKILIAGEYAVLEGHVAVVMAVNRRVIARYPGASPRETSSFLDAAAKLIADQPAQVERLGRLSVDSTALRAADGSKLGIGSSAAVVVSALAAAMASDRLDRERLLALAFRAHGDAQQGAGTRGSGADVAAAVYGGVLAVRSGGVAPIDHKALELPADLSLVPVWTGQSAHTPTLVAQVRAGAARNPAEYHTAIAHIATASRQFIEGCTTHSARAAVAAIHSGADALAALARACEVPLITAAHKQIRAMAASRGGAAKATGAGGGDIALAAFADRAQAERFRSDLALAGMDPVDVDVDRDGVLVSSTSR